MLSPVRSLSLSAPTDILAGCCTFDTAHGTMNPMPFILTLVAREIRKTLPLSFLKIQRYAERRQAEGHSQVRKRAWVQHAYPRMAERGRAPPRRRPGSKRTGEASRGKKGKAPSCTFPIPLRSEDRLTVGSLDLVSSGLLDQGDDALRHRHIVDIRGHLLAVPVTPVKEFEGCRRRHKSRRSVELTPQKQTLI
jgi:hypothetical protein